MPVDASYEDATVTTTVRDAWANDRYFSMLNDRDRWERRYRECRRRLTRSRWLTLVVTVAALVGWLR